MPQFKASQVALGHFQQIFTEHTHACLQDARTHQATCCSAELSATIRSTSLGSIQSYLASSPINPSFSPMSVDEKQQLLVEENQDSRMLSLHSESTLQWKYTPSALATAKVRLSHFLSCSLDCPVYQCRSLSVVLKTELISERILSVSTEIKATPHPNMRSINKVAHWAKALHPHNSSDTQFLPRCNYELQKPKHSKPMELDNLLLLEDFCYSEYKQELQKTHTADTT